MAGKTATGTREKVSRPSAARCRARALRYRPERTRSPHCTEQGIFSSDALLRQSQHVGSTCPPKAQNLRTGPHGRYAPPFSRCRAKRRLGWGQAGWDADGHTGRSNRAARFLIYHVAVFHGCGRESGSLPEGPHVSSARVYAGRSFSRLAQRDPIFAGTEISRRRKGFMDVCATQYIARKDITERS